MRLLPLLLCVALLVGPALLRAEEPALPRDPLEKLPSAPGENGRRSTSGAATATRAARSGCAWRGGPDDIS